MNSTNYLRSERGTSMLEYCLLGSFIILAAITVIAIIGGDTSEIFCEAGNGFRQARGGPIVMCDTPVNNGGGNNGG